MQHKHHLNGPPCPEHGLVARYVSSGACIECARSSALASRRRRLKGEPPSGRGPYRLARPNIVNDARRLQAIAEDHTTWHGPDCRHGHGGLRYTSKTAACVECRRQSNKDYHDGR